MCKRGSVLVIAVWLVMIMAIFGVGLAGLVRSHYFFARFKVNRFLSDEGGNAVLMACKLDRMLDTTSYDTLLELREEKEYESGNIKLVYFFVDEESKININTSPGSVLKELPGMSLKSASAITASTARPFHVKEEILLVKGMEEEDYRNIEDLITVYGKGEVNINTCSKEVMEILGMQSGLVDDILSFREGADGKPGTDDDRAFKSAEGIVADLENAYGLSARDKLALELLVSRRMLGVKSENYCIKITAHRNKRITDKYAIIVGKAKGANKYPVKRWSRE